MSDQPPPLPPPVPAHPGAVPPPFPGQMPPSSPPPLPDNNGGPILASLLALATPQVKAERVSSTVVRFSGRAEVKAFLGKTVVTYEAVATLVTDRRSLEFRETLVEKSSGLSGSSFGVSSESYSQSGVSRSEKKKVNTLGGEYEYFYGALREAAAEIARRNGWTLKVQII